MIMQFQQNCDRPDMWGEQIRAGLQAVLDTLPDLEPFHFTGFPNSTVYMHSTCGTVVDVVPGSDTWEDVEQGNCDCENSAPWYRVYVRKDVGQ
jgi:hypothetical protein